MELQLKQASIDAYETAGEIVLAQEETAETIVPDYCPDIARVIEASGVVFLHSREVREGRAELSGTVQVTILYTPEGEGGIRNLEFSVPFQVSSDNRSLAECTALAAETEAESLETRLLNPRKLFTHCKLVTRLTAYRRRPLTYAADVECDQPLEKRVERQHAVVLTQIAARDFTFTDELSISPGRPGAEELLSARVYPVVQETRIIGNKLIFKGIFTLSLLYLDLDGGCNSYTGELPFSQILDVEGTPEDAQATVRLQLTGIDLQIGSDPDGRQIEAALYLHAFALLRQERDLELLSDLYSTACEVRFEAAPLSAASWYDCQTRRQSVRELLELGMAADAILAVRVQCGAVSVSREGADTVLRTTAAIRVLYRDEGGVPLAAERRVDVSCETDLPENAAVTARASCPEEPQASIGERGIEVRFPVEFVIEAENEVKKIRVVSAQLDVDAPRDTSAAPSLVLRRLNPDETAWDLAKAYNSTIADILEANQFSEAELPRDRLLLIPRRRA